MIEQVLSHFGLSQMPFAVHLNPNDRFPSHACTEALARLSFGVAEEELLLVTGRCQRPRSGSGNRMKISLCCS